MWKCVRIVFAFNFLLTVYGRSQPEDWIQKYVTGPPTFSCDGVGSDAGSYRWFHVIYGFLVFEITSANDFYRVTNSTLTVLGEHFDDRDVFCEAQAENGDPPRVWRSRKAQLRVGKSARVPDVVSRFFDPLKVEALNTPAVQAAFEGDSLSVACNFTAANASSRTTKRRVQWLHNGRPVTEDSVYHYRIDTETRKSVLYIVQFESKLHEGVYQCMVEKRERSWRPLHNPLLIAPSGDRSSSKLAGLPFYDYEIVTVSVITTNDENLYEPTIVPVHGHSFSVAVPNTPEDVHLTSVVVSDMDRGRAGRINCSLTCSTRSCPRFTITSSSAGSLVGSIDWLSNDASQQLDFNLTCTDDGKERKASSVTFRVTITQDAGPEKRESKITKRLLQLGGRSVEKMKTTETRALIRNLTNITEEAENFSFVDVAMTAAKTAEVVESLAKKKDIQQGNVLQQLTQLMSNTMEAKKQVTESNPKLDTVAMQLLKTVDKLADAAVVTKSGHGVQSHRTDNIAIGAAAIHENNSGAQIVFSSRSGGTKDAVITKERGKEDAVAISLRKDQVVGSSVSFVMYNDADLFKTLEKTNSVRILPPVLSARAALKRWVGGTPPVQLTFKSELSGKAFCAFWTNNRTWDRAGCNTTQHGLNIFCNCSHLTNFALIMDIDPTPVNPLHHLVLSFLSYFFLSFSCLALILTIGVYCSYMRRKKASSRSGQRSSASAITRSKILISISATLLLAHSIFLLTSFYHASGIFCKMIGITLHFFYISTFMWSMIEGLNIFFSSIYMALRSDHLRLDNSHFFTKGAVFAWGSAAVIVIITAAATAASGYGPLYGSATESKEFSLCFLPSGLPFYLAFLMPVALCLIVNIVITVLLLFVLIRRSSRSTSAEKRQTKKRLIGFLSVCVTLNITWLLGMFQFDPVKVVMNYLFVIFNGLQGALIFLFYCFLHKDIRHHLIFCRRRTRRGSTTSSGTVSAGNTRKTSATAIQILRRRQDETMSTSHGDTEMSLLHPGNK